MKASKTIVHYNLVEFPHRTLFHISASFLQGASFFFVFEKLKVQVVFKVQVVKANETNKQKTMINH